MDIYKVSAIASKMALPKKEYAALLSFFKGNNVALDNKQLAKLKKVIEKEHAAISSFIDGAKRL